MRAAIQVKLVLAAAMWQNPHMLIMDEPTNYLDREALGALAEAVNKWTGGVVIISHHQEFIGAVCQEVGWLWMHLPLPQTRRHTHDTGYADTWLT